MKKLTALLLSFILIFNINVFANTNILEDAQTPTEEVVTEEEFTTDTYENYIIDSAVDTVEKLYVFDDVTELDMYKNALKQIIAKNPELMDEALKGIFNNLDPHSEYYTPEEYDAFMQSLSNELCGIGVMVSEHEEGLLVASIIKNTPASKSGIKKYDVIIGIDDTIITGMSLNEAKALIAGEKGTDVKITVMRNGERIEFVIKRDTIISEVGYYQLIDDNKIGYICIYGFDGHCAEFVLEAVKYFQANNIESVIIDLRDNPGGSLAEFVDVCQFFIPSGPVIKLVGKSSSSDATYYSSLEEPIFKNLVVLINNHSASASEAFAGAVQDTRVGVVIGNNSYGKGTKQLVSRIISGGGVRLTDAEYLTAGGRHIHGKGIVPDIDIDNQVVKYNKKYFDEFNHDSVLKLGDTSPNVKAFKQRLDALGFEVGVPNEIYDESMYYAVLDFQYMTGLYPYGVLDITTQMKLINVVTSSEIQIDKQLEKAIEVINDGNLEKYMSVDLSKEIK